MLNNRNWKTSLTIITTLALTLLLSVQSIQAEGPLFQEIEPVFQTAIMKSCEKSKASIEDKQLATEKLEIALTKAVASTIATPIDPYDHDLNLCTDTGAILDCVRQAREGFEIKEVHMAHEKLHTARNMLQSIRWRNGQQSMTDRIWILHHIMHEALHVLHNESGPDVKISDEAWQEVTHAATSHAAEIAAIQIYIAKNPSKESNTKLVKELSKLDKSTQAIIQASEKKSPASLQIALKDWRTGFRSTLKSALPAEK